MQPSHSEICLIVRLSICADCVWTRGLSECLNVMDSGDVNVLIVLCLLKSLWSREEAFGGSGGDLRVQLSS